MKQLKKDTNNTPKIYCRNKTNKNEVKITVKIDKNDVNNKIYFLDNVVYYDDYLHEHESLKELSPINTQVYIYYYDQIRQYEYRKYFIPKYEGTYLIKLIFSIKLKDCTDMFAHCDNIINIDFSSFDSSNY